MTKRTDYLIRVHLETGSYFPGESWAAIDDNTYDGRETDPVGRGSTAAEAVEDLIRQLEDRADD